MGYYLQSFSRMAPKKQKLPSIYLCIVLDIIGMLSYLLPVGGEFFDFIWAPISGILFFILFGSSRFALFGGIFSVLEEISPGLDVIPTFTLAWFVKRKKEERKIAHKGTI